MREAAQGEEGLSQGLILGAGFSKAEASDHANGVDGGEQVKALIPAQTVAPANVDQTGQPASAAAFARKLGVVSRLSAALLCARRSERRDRQTARARGTA